MFFFSISQNLNLHPVLAKLDADVINENDGTMTSSDDFKPIVKAQISKAEVQLFVKNIFLRPFQALADKKDLLFCFSTSGNSQNIIRVLKEAKKRKIYSISLLGNYGGLAKKYTNLPLIVKSNDTANIQETHVFLSHYILKNVEDRVIKAFRK